MEEEKPNAQQLGWRLRRSSTPFENKVFAIRDDELAVNGKETRYACMVRAQAVIIVPVTSTGQIVTVRQYRYPVDQWCVEIPAGGTHDTGDESLREVARKELREEIGGECSDLSHIGSFYTAPSFTDELCHVFIAHDVQLTKKPRTETTEEIEFAAVPAADVVDLARRGEIKAAPCALAVLMAEPFLRERGYLA